MLYSTTATPHPAPRLPGRIPPAPAGCQDDPHRCTGKASPARLYCLWRGIRGHRRSAPRAARAPQRGTERRESRTRLCRVRRGVRGHRRSAARAAREHRTGPREKLKKRRRRSVSRVLFPRSPSGDSSHSSGPPVARGIERPTRGNGRTTRARPDGPGLPPTRSCSGWGLPSIRPHERIWRALTSPFHPCSGRVARGGLLSVALSPDRSRPPLAATLPCGVRTFLPPRSAAGGCSTSSGARGTAVATRSPPPSRRASIAYAGSSGRGSPARCAGSR